ncbi:MAG: zinc ribbon domain-containing protein, partial [Bacilli bacterium]
TLSTKYCEKCYQDGEWTKTDDGMYSYNFKKIPYLLKLDVTENR